jgi:hypothetical protein
MNEFPIESQTSEADRQFILRARQMLRGATQTYRYVEVGSFLGGSLTPFIADPACLQVLSIDEREKELPDERGINYDYSGITSQSMLDNLVQHGFDISKVEAFDGSVQDIGLRTELYDLAFIDGEHTDLACFRDFAYTLPLLRSDALVMFHDSSLVHKALRIIMVYLESRAIDYRYIKGVGSEMSVILLGKYVGKNYQDAFGVRQDVEQFYAEAETRVIQSLLRNRTVVEFNMKVVPPKTKKAY